LVATDLGHTLNSYEMPMCGEWIKGTGKYEGMKGNFSYSGYYITPYNKETKGDVVINVKGSYTLSK